MWWTGIRGRCGFLSLVFLGAVFAFPGLLCAAENQPSIQVAQAQIPAAKSRIQDDNSPELYRKAADYYYKISGSGKTAGKKEWLKCVELFREVYTFHPAGQKSPEALYMTGKIYKELYHRFKESEYRDNAVSIFRVLAKSHAHSTLADDALYLSGELYREDGDISNALTSYRGVVAWFPEGDMQPQALKRVEELEPLEAKALRKGKKVFADLKAVRFYSGDNYARLVFDLSKMVNYRIIRSDDDHSLTVDLLGARLGDSNAKDLERKQGMISRIQVTQAKDDLSRIFLTLTRENHFNSIELDNPDRIVVDIYGEEPKEEVIPLAGGEAGGDATRALEGAAEAGTGAVTAAAGAAASTAAGVAGALAEGPGDPEPEPVIEPEEAKPEGQEGVPFKSISAVEKSLPTGKDSYEAVKVEVVKQDIKQPRKLEFKDVSLRKKEIAGSLAKKGSDLTKVAKAGARGAPAFIEAGISLPSAGKAKKRPSRPEPVKKASISPRTEYGLKTIVIDAGHGGKDPGAVGKGGLKEKDVTLDIALRLRNRLKHECGCRIVMTRATDVFIPLEKRTAIANSVNADLFISIHVNAAENRRARGVETYFLSPARSKRALYTAARENMVKKSRGSKNLDDINFIFSDMQNTNKINESNSMAENVQNSLVNTLRNNYRTKDLGVKSAMFYVLHGARMPSILVETAFISNREEEKRLKTSAFRERVAKGIAGGVERYAKSGVLAMAR